MDVVGIIEFTFRKYINEIVDVFMLVTIITYSRCAAIDGVVSILIRGLNFKF